MWDNDVMLSTGSKIDRVLERAISVLPSAIRPRVNHAYRRRAFHRYLERKLGSGFRAVEPALSAPAELVARTSGLTEADAAAAANPDAYFSGGYLGVLFFLRLLEKYSFNLRTVESILDFGCGTGKNIRLLRCIDGVRLVGTDVNPLLIEWARANVPGVEFMLNDLKPPLAFAEDEIFDLITAASVFTHIPLDLQSDWLAELHRILRTSGGYFICTVAGRFHAERQLSGVEQDRLYRVGAVTLSADDPGVSFATKQARSWDVFQTRAEVLHAFGDHFTVVDYLANPQGQDVLIMQK